VIDVRRSLILLIVFVLLSISFGSFLYLVPLSVDFPEELYESTGTRSFLVKYFTLFEDEFQKGIVFSGWIFSPSDQATATVEVKLEGEKEQHSFSVEAKRKGFYLVIPPHLLVFPKDLKVFIGKYEVGGEPR